MEILYGGCNVNYMTLLDYLGGNKGPIDVANKSKWDNKNNEACGFIKIFFSSDSWFHVQGIDDSNEARDKLESVFGKHNEIRSH
jgi:hypothetical protein